LIARLLAALALLAAVAAVAPAASAQESATRFEITAVADTTFSIRIGERSGWVRRGLEGIAVDPRRRDLLIARFRVVDVSDGEAVALITGQTTLVETEHVALLTRPRTPWYRQRGFWVGLLLGGAIGGAAGAAF
jgi:hypothetical protein